MATEHVLRKSLGRSCHGSLILVSLSSAEHAVLLEMVSELSSGLIGIKHEQEYMEVRERIHRMSKCRLRIPVDNRNVFH